MRKLIILLISITFFSCSEDAVKGDDSPCTYTPTLTTNEVSDITDTSVIFSGEIEAPTCEGTVTSQGFVYSRTTLPKIDDIVIEVNGGNISSKSPNLKQFTKYYMRTFFVNPTGEYYGNQVEFTTAIGDVNITTKEIQDITYHSAKSGGVITTDGGANITSRGVCWSTNPKPTIQDNKTVEGQGKGSFDSTLTNLNEEATYYVRAYATNEEMTNYGNELILNVSGRTLIPDGVFESHLISKGYDDILDNYVTTSNISNITELNLPDGISDLTGISEFVMLEYLSLYCNKLTSFDISNNLNLKILYVGGNDDNSSVLTKLDVSKNINLVKLHVGFNPQITSLDVSNNINLQELSIRYEPFTCLDLTNNVNLTHLTIEKTPITNLNLSNLPALSRLYCYENQLTSLDVSNNSALISLSCVDNQLTSLDVTNNPLLETLYCSNNYLTSLNVSNNSALIQLTCANNQLTSLDVSNNSDLTSLYCRLNLISCIQINNSQLNNIPTSWNKDITANYSLSCN